MISKYWFHKINMLREYAPLISICTVISLVIVLCDSVDENGNTDLGIGTALRFIVSYILLLAIFILFYKHSRNTPINNKLDNLKINIKELIISTLLMVILWMPWLIALYPANFLGDTLISIGWYFKTANGSTGLIYDHNPVLTVYLFGAVAWIGKYILHNVSLALFALVLVQSIVTAFSLTLTLYYGKYHLGVGRKGFISGYLFFSLCPLFPVWSNYLSKDTLYCPFYLFFFVGFIEIIRSRGAILEKKTFVTAMIVTSILACLTKKLGYYIILGSCIIALIWLIATSRNYLKRICSQFIIVFTLIGVMSIILPHIIFPLASIREGERYESLAVPLQQTARYVRDHPDDVTNEERQSIDHLLRYNDLAERYTYWIADPVKSVIKEPNEAYGAWMKTWIRQGIRHPLTYLRAYISLEKGFGSSTSTITVRLDSSDMKPYDDAGIAEAYERYGLSYNLNQLAQKTYNWISNLPLIETLFRSCIYGLILPMLLLSCAFMTRKKMRLQALLMTVPVMLTLGGVWLSPISIYIDGGRYLLPMLQGAPIYIYLSIYFIKSCKVQDKLKSSCLEANIA